MANLEPALLLTVQRKHHMAKEPPEPPETPEQLEQPMAKLGQADHLTPANKKDQELANHLQIPPPLFKPKNTDDDSI